MLLNSPSPAAAGRALVRLVLSILFLALVTAGTAQAQAQAQQEPPKIRKIEIKFVGLTTVPDEVVRANMSLREGMPYDLTLVDRDIRSLFRTGLFKTIDVRDVEVSRTQVDLVFELRAKSRIGAVRFEGNEKMSTKKLQSETTILLNPVADEAVIKNDKDKIEALYRKAGYSQVKVEYVISEDPITGLATVVFRIEEGPKVKITKVDFVGNEMVKDKALRGEIETSKWQWWSFMTGSGKYDDKKFDEDLDKVVDFYKEKGFLDVVVDPAKITFSYPQPDEMTITIQVQEGKQYRIGDVTVSGNKLFPSEVLVRVARIRTGDMFAPRKLDEEVENMENFYGQFGYLDTRAQLIRRPNVTTGAIDIEFKIVESGRYIVQSVDIEGNTKTKSVVVLREILLAPGDVFDSVRMETSRLRLENTRFFEDVDVRAMPTTIPNRKDLKISFTEGRTGNLTFGAGYSSLEGAVFYIELTQANFDMFNRRSFFQGDGQKFRLKTQVGSSSSEIVLGFEEPFLFERELNFGFTIFRERSDYTSSYYDEIHQGFEVYLRKRLIELVTGRLSYRLQNVEIFNIDPSVIEIFGGENKTKTSSVSLVLERDTRNSLLTPSRGSNIQGIFEVGGGPLGGDVDYYKIEGRLAQYFQLFQVQNQVLEILARTGVAQEYGDTLTIPIYDRFFLGGQNNLRGFEYRDVGPKTLFGEPIGGKTYGYLSLEYSADIVAPMRFAIFYDAGFVNRGSFDFNPSDFNDNFGFGVRFFLLGQPMRIDYGIPLTTDRTNDKGGQFNFSFGTRF